MTTIPAPGLGHALDLSSTEPTPFGRLVRVELRKTWDTRAGFWLLLSIAALTAVVMVIQLSVVVVQDINVTYNGFLTSTNFSVAVLLPILGILLLTSEWSQRTAMVTFALEPRRSRVIAAKALVGVVLTLATVVVSTVIGAVCNALYGLIEGHVDWTFGWSDFGAFTITQVLAMFGGFALAALFLNTPAAIVVFFIYKWVLPGLFALGAGLMAWFDHLRPWVDFQVAQEAIWDWSTSGRAWAELVVSGFVWLGIPLAWGIWRVLRAEVK